MSDGIFDLSKEASIAATVVGPTVMVIGGSVLDYLIYRREQAGLDFITATLSDPASIVFSYLGMNTAGRTANVLQRHTYLTAAAPLSLVYLASLGISRYHSEKANGVKKSAKNWLLGTAAYGSLFSTLFMSYAYYGESMSDLTIGQNLAIPGVAYVATGIVLGIIESQYS